jgi:hypothetical protein
MKNKSSLCRKQLNTLTIREFKVNNLILATTAEIRRATETQKVLHTQRLVVLDIDLLILKFLLNLMLQTQCFTRKICPKVSAFHWILQSKVMTRPKVVASTIKTTRLQMNSMTLKKFRTFKWNGRKLSS